jgi:hypothetical protein
MVFRMIPMVWLCICLLQGCRGIGCHDGVCAPVQKVPENPDGVCPEITGTYQGKVDHGFHDESDIPWQSTSSELHVHALGRVHGAMERDQLQGVRLLNPTGEKIVPEAISIERRDDNTLRIINVSSAGLLDSVASVDTSPKNRVCDKGQAFFSFNVGLHGEFGLPAGGLRGVFIVSKDETGDIIQKEYSYRSNTIYYGKDPGGKRSVRFFRFRKLSDAPLEVILPQGFVFPE